MKRLLLALVVGLVLVPAASAGGWATVQLSAVPSDGIRAGTPIGIEITVLQHGQTPLDGVTPVFQILDLDTGEVVREVQGAPTGKPGVYHVDVAFPRAGTFAYQVYDGFVEYGGAQTHTFASVEVAAPGGSASPGSSGWTVWGAAGLAGGLLVLLTGAVLLVWGLRHRSTPAVP